MPFISATREDEAMLLINFAPTPRLLASICLFDRKSTRSFSRPRRRNVF
ncbi:MAG TPA: hypothetical protein VEX60_14660 [Pyrinomonadaceae bacterium]|nr:hypothetical protein [Pyrinomonadaceae bacterium]